jgi:dipeptidyl aminopeptidase/acylaminoacyl peptidase
VAPLGDEQAMTDSALEELYRQQLPSDPTISPDGGRIVYVLRSIDREKDEYVHSLWRVDRDGSPRRLTQGRADTSPRYSPDGTTIAFLRAQDGPRQLWLLPAAGGEAERLTDLPLGAGVPVWSPDGTRIAFAALVNPSQDADDAPIVADRLVHKLDGLGRLRGMGPQLFVLDLVDRSVRQITHDAFMGVPAWSPDGTKLLCADEMAAFSDLSQDATAFLVDPSTSERSPVGPERGRVVAVSWHGSAQILVATPDKGPFNRVLLRVDGDSTVPLTAELDRNVMPGKAAYPGALPQATGDTLLFCARDNGCTHLYAHDGSTRKLVGGDRVVSGLSVAGDTAAIIVSTVDTFGEVAFMDVATGALTVVTDYADGVPRAVPQARSFRISDGVEVQAWMLRAPQAPTPGPLLVDVHGGPHNAWNPVRDPVHLYHQELLAQGWTILLINPRASDGYGEKFLRAALGAWGEADEPDFLEPVDALVAEGTADPARLALTGYSYGGFMACWLPTRTARFAAVVAGGVLCDLLSMAGTSDVGAEMTRYQVSADIDRLRALSPISGVDAVTSPTLILHGAADERCPVGQAEQWHHGLCSREVPTELVLYPGASHLFILDGKPSHRHDYSRRIVDWLNRHTATRT